jgi:hypothetical protein
VNTPVEIALNALLSSAIVFVLFGASMEAGAWYSVFAALGEFYYHMNVRTPRWSGWFLQRPEHHSIHHQRLPGRTRAAPGRDASLPGRQRLSMTRLALPTERSTRPTFTSALMPM